MTCKEIKNVVSMKSPIPGVFWPFLWLINGGYYLLTTWMSQEVSKRLVRGL